MQRTLAKDLKESIGKEVLVSGWLHKKRELGGMVFILLRDRSGITQVLIEKSTEIKKLDGIQVGSILNVIGKVIKEERASSGVEIHEPKISVEVGVGYPSPIEIDKSIPHTPETLDTLFEYRVLNMRNVAEQGIWKIQKGVGDSLREYLRSLDFTEFHSPKLLAEATEGGAEVFKLDYFGKQATLAQSAQFYKQIMVGAYERVFEFGPTYRAEPSMTTRHMTEFTTVDVEMGFIEGVSDLLDILSDSINKVVSDVWSKYEKELTALKAEKPVLSKKFPEITLKDLHELYFKETGEDTRKEKDPTPAEERFISGYSKKTWGSEAIFVTEFPASGMKFYHFRNEKNPEVAERADLIFRGIEVVTASRREHRYEKLIEQLKDIGGDPADPGYRYYLQAFQYGLPSHGGFGLGLERLTQTIIGLKNVKEATLFPRDINRLSP